MPALPGLPALPTAAPSPPSYVAGAAASSSDASMASIEASFRRLLGQTKNDIISESSNVIAAHVADSQTDITAVRSELSSERDERLEHQREVDARIAAAEASLRARLASAPETPSKLSLAVVGRFGSSYKSCSSFGTGSRLCSQD